jgi:transcriptional regulator with XRE-family HTH domain
MRGNRRVGSNVYIADRLRLLREYRNLSQGDMAKRTGLRRCYISRVENGHAFPALETLEKISRALEVPLYQFFYDGKKTFNTKPPSPVREKGWASHGKGLKVLTKMRRALGRMSDRDRQILLTVAVQMSDERG